MLVSNVQVFNKVSISIRVVFFAFASWLYFLSYLMNFAGVVFSQSCFSFDNLYHFPINPVFLVLIAVLVSLNKF